MNPPMMLTYKGETKTLNEWSDIVRINKKAIWFRIKHHGWTVEAALEIPIKGNNVEISRRRRIDRAIETWNEIMLCRGYFRKENRIRVYKMLNTWYKEFRSENMKAA